MKRKVLFLLIACIPSVWIQAADYVAFSETFGNPTTPISRTTDNNSSVDTVTSNITAGTYVDLNGRQGGDGSAILLDNTATAWTNTGTTAISGVIASTAIFNAATPILGAGGSGGFAAYTLGADISRTGSPWTFMRIFVDGSRFVAGANYTFSFQYNSGANANWIWTGGNNTTTTDVMVRGYIYSNVLSLSTPTNHWNNINAAPSGQTSSYGDSPEYAGTNWQTYSVTAGAGTGGNSGTVVGVGAGANVVCDIRAWLNKGSVLLVDNLNITGPQPELTSTEPSVTLPANGADTVSISCNAAGTYGIYLSITGPGAAYFTITDSTGAPFANNHMKLPGEKVIITYTPDASVTTAQTATLTLSASPDSYGAAPLAIPLTGSLNAGINIPTVSNATIIDNGGSVTIKVAQKSSVQIYSVSGELVAKASVSDSYSCPLNAGIYIVKVNGVSHKFVKK